MAPFRVSDPTLGRWLQIDPIEKYHESGYAWVTNNPILYMDPLGLDTVKSDPDTPVDIDDVVELDDVVVTVEPMTQEEEAEYDWEQNKHRSIYSFEIGDKVLGHRDGVPGLEDFFGPRTFGPFDVNAQGYITRYTPTTGIAPSPNTAITKVGSVVKKSQSLLKIAQKLGKNRLWRLEVNKLIKELSRGNFNAGKGAKPIFGNIHEMRGAGGARVYFRNTSEGYEIVGYSDKPSQTKVIKELKNLYGKK